MLEVKGISKTFGTYKALDTMHVTVEKGKILGLIGKNGAGKSTTFRIILDFISADTGEVLWNGHPISKRDYDSVGYLPEERGLSIKMTIEDQLYYLAELKGLTRKEISPKIDDWLKLFEVKGKRKDKIKTLSKGNQQKVQVIAALLHEPDLVILDEPFSGLDPVNAGILKQAIFALKERGACVIFSSHNMENVEELCDELIMLDNGKTVLSGTVQSVRESFGRLKVFVESHHSVAELQNIEGVVHVEEARHSGIWLTLENEEVGKRVFDYITKEGYVQTFSQQPLSLEEIFKLKAGEVS